MSVRAFSKFLASLSLFACASVFATPLVVNVAGIESTGEQYDPANTVLTYNVGANAHVTSVSYNVTLTAFGESYLSEMFLSFTDSDGNGVYFNPGYEDAGPGTGSYSDSVDLTSIGLDFYVGTDGLLVLEFFEDYFDEDTFPNGIWQSGTVTFNIEPDVVVPPTDVPEPATVLLLGAGLAALGYTSRRRRTAAAV